MAARALYRLLLLAFPSALRRRHGDDMAQLFSDHCRDARVGTSATRGVLRVAGLWLLALRDATTNGILARFGDLGRGAPGEGRGDRGRGDARRSARLSTLDVFLYDLRHAARGLRSSPGFTAVALISLALGIGASTAIFTLIDTVVLRPLPVRAPRQLVQVTMSAEAMGMSTKSLTNPLWESLRDRQRVFDGVFAISDTYFPVGPEHDPERTRGAWVSGGFFSTLGLQPAAGRLIDPGDDSRGCPGVVTLGHGYWQRRFGGDDVVGETISLSGHPFEIVGVVEPAFAGMMIEAVTELYAPVCAEAILRGEGSILDASRTWWLQVIGRRPAEVGIERIRAELAGMTPALLADGLPQDWSPSRQQEFLASTFEVRPAASGFSDLRERYERSLYLLLAAVGVVMLVVCGNLANLLLARAARRRKEIAMRVALGASSGRLVRQFLTESLLLAGIGAMAGTVLARWASDALVRLITPAGQTLSLDLALDGRILAFTCAVSIATGVLFGLAPAAGAARLDGHAAMRGIGSGGAPSWRAGGALVTAQLTLSLVLVTGAALLVGTFWHLERLDPGFDRDRPLLVDVDIRNAELGDEQRRQAFLEMNDRLRAVPGVKAASLAEVTPVSGNSVTEFLVAEGFESLLDEDAEIFVHRVGDGYFASMGAPVLRGRDLNAGDELGREPVALLSESAARLLFDTVDVVGRRFHRRLNDTEVSEPFRVVGVVGDAKYRSLRDESTPTVYFARRQNPVSYWGAQETFQVLPETDPAVVAPMVRTSIEQFMPGARLEIRMLSEQLSGSLSRERLLAVISAFFASLALLLAAVGLYGVMAFDVSRRFPEMGVRLALGSTASGVFVLVMRQAARPVIFGLVFGGLGSLALARSLESQLYGLSPLDNGGAFFLSAAVLAAAAMASAAIPARRAARLEPALVLRRDRT